MWKSVKSIVENGVKNMKIVKNCQIIVKNVTKCIKLVAIILSMEKVQKTYFWGFKVLKKITIITKHFIFSDLFDCNNDLKNFVLFLRKEDFLISTLFPG